MSVRLSFDAKTSRRAPISAEKTQTQARVFSNPGLVQEIVTGSEKKDTFNKVARAATAAVSTANDD